MNVGSASRPPPSNWSTFADTVGHSLRALCWCASLICIGYVVFDGCRSGILPFGQSPLPLLISTIAGMVVFAAITVGMRTFCVYLCGWIDRQLRDKVKKDDSKEIYWRNGRNIICGIIKFAFSVALPVSATYLASSIPESDEGDEHLKLILLTGLACFLMNLAISVDDDFGVAETILSFALGIISFQSADWSFLKMVGVCSIPASKYIIYPICAFVKELASLHDASATRVPPVVGCRFKSVVGLVDKLPRHSNELTESLLPPRRSGQVILLEARTKADEILSIVERIQTRRAMI